MQCASSIASRLTGVWATVSRRVSDASPPGAQQRRHLVAQRLPRPRGEYGEDVSAGEQRSQDSELMDPEPCVTESLHEDRSGGIEAHAPSLRPEPLAPYPKHATRGTFTRHASLIPRDT